MSDAFVDVCLGYSRGMGFVEGKSGDDDVGEKNDCPTN